MQKRLHLLLAASLLTGCGSNSSDVSAGSNNFTAQPLNVTYVDQTASLRGDVTLGRDVFVAPFARVDGTVQIADRSNVQDNCVVEGTVSIGADSAIAHGARVLGPARLEGKNFVGFNSLVDGATLESGAYVDIAAHVGPGIRLRGMRVLPGKSVTRQAEADDPALGKVTPLTQAQADFLAGVVKVNVELANGYNVLARERGTLTGIGPNPLTHFTPLSVLPIIVGQYTNDPAFRNRVVGNVRLEDPLPQLAAKMGFRDSVRADEGQHVGFGVLGSMGDEVTFHALEDTGIECGTGCHFGRHSVIHGGADDTVGSESTELGDNVRVGDGAIVFRSILADGCVIGERALVDKCDFPAGTVIGPREVWVGNQRTGTVEW